MNVARRVRAAGLLERGKRVDELLWDRSFSRAAQPTAQRGRDLIRRKT